MRDPDLDIAGVLDDAEEDPGGFVALNSDDDYPNGVPDVEDLATLGVQGYSRVLPAWEDDLIDLTLRTADYANAAEIALRFKIGHERIRVYQKESDGSVTRLEPPDKVWPAGDGFVNPTTVVVEGVEPSQLLRDVSMRLVHKAEVYGQDCPDVVKLTVVSVDLDVDANNDGTIDPDNTSAGTDDVIEADPALPGKILAVNDDHDEGKVDAGGNPLSDLEDPSPVSSNGQMFVLDDMTSCGALAFPKDDPDPVIML